jgi:hypothetical protein
MLKKGFAVVFYCPDANYTGTDVGG